MTSPVGFFTPAPYYPLWIDHHSASKSIWILSLTSFNYGEIIQYDDNNFNIKATYYYYDNYKSRSIQAHYVFANRDGMSHEVSLCGH